MSLNVLRKAKEDLLSLGHCICLTQLVGEIYQGRCDSCDRLAKVDLETGVRNGPAFERQCDNDVEWD